MAIIQGCAYKKEEEVEFAFTLLQLWMQTVSIPQFMQVFSLSDVALMKLTLLINNGSKERYKLGDVKQMQPEEAEWKQIVIENGKRPVKYSRQAFKGMKKASVLMEHIELSEMNLQMVQSELNSFDLDRSVVLICRKSKTATVQAKCKWRGLCLKFCVDNKFVDISCEKCPFLKNPEYFTRDVYSYFRDAESGSGKTFY